VQAFLRDELLAFCREAPPEFNDHQRDVFCVFSGNGVGRLREFLNQQKAHAAGENASLAGSVIDANSEMGDAADDATGTNSESDGVNTPVMQLNVEGNHAPGATPVVPTPVAGQTPPTLVTQALQNQTGWHQQLGPLNLSQSAPASTGPAFWNFNNVPAGLGLVTQGGGGGAQQVTGMMGAAILDDVDEGDEAFGEGSEIMGD
jgi:F-box and leucine-rich repeat protein GRR1